MPPVSRASGSGWTLGRGTASVGLAALLLIVLVAGGCGSSSNDDGSGSSDDGGSGDGPKIALFLPQLEAPRYETLDRPEFQAAVTELCPACELVYENAGGDPGKQRSQVEAALEQGADALVVAPVYSRAPAIAGAAKAAGVPVVSYDRLLEGGTVDAFVGFDNEEIGELQARLLAKKLRQDGHPAGPIVMINGARRAPSAAALARGARRVFDAAGVEVAKAYDTPGWYAEDAQIETKEALAALGKDGFVAVYGANDDIANGVILALEEEGIDPGKMSVTGQDATTAGLQQILAGEQYMTVYKRIPPEARISAEIAIALAEGKAVPRDRVTGEVDNGAGKVPAVVLKPIAVTNDNLKSTVIADKYVYPSDLCLGPYVKVCREAGLGS